MLSNDSSSSRLPKTSAPTQVSKIPRKTAKSNSQQSLRSSESAVAPEVPQAVLEDPTYSEVVENSSTEPQFHGNGVHSEKMALVEPPLYKEVLENSSCAPVLHEHKVVVGPDGAQLNNGYASATNPLHLDERAFPSVTEVAELTKQSAQLAEANGNPILNRQISLPMAFVNRVATIPSVAETVNLFKPTVAETEKALKNTVSKVSDSIESIARRNRVAKIAVDTTKQTVTYGVSLADKLTSPVKPVLGDVLVKIDTRAADLVDQGIKKYPILGKQPSEIASEVRNQADATAHRVLAFKPASVVVSLTAKTVLSVNRGVESVLRKTQLQAPDRHTQWYSRIDEFANGVLSVADESRQRAWQRSVPVA